eukprot:4493127-Ditylum_brightwellii.AAC.1
MRHNQEKSCPSKDDSKPMAESKYVPLLFVVPLKFLNHACKEHCNMIWGCVSGKRYKCTLKKAVRKGGKMVINYYADK